MHILLVNDDGIRGAGLIEMCRAAMAAGYRVTVAAPDGERSATSHSLTIVPPLLAHKTSVVGAPAYAINGTPADCAKLGLYLLNEAGDPADIVLSGINKGPNAGSACVYSGTVNAAMEAAMCGFPALATSLDSFASEDFTSAARVTLAVVEWMKAHPLTGGAFYNLNSPALPYERIKGVKSARLAPQFLVKPRYTKCVSPLGLDYYWLSDIPHGGFEDDDYDVTLLERGYATLSVLTWDIARPMDDTSISLPAEI